MYEVQWAASAEEDLLIKVKTARVAHALIDVSRTALDDHTGPDGGTVGPYLWRRGLTTQQREQLDATRTEIGREEPWDFILVYKRRGRLRSGYEVLSVLSNAELISSLVGQAPAPDM